MTTPNDIKWGAYQQFEGPFFRGTVGFTIPDAPTDNQKLMAVLSATEGGHYDAINMYDACILTAGIIQWCERGQFSVSDMLGAICKKDPDLLDPLTAAMPEGVEFRQNYKGRYRFFFHDDRGEVDTTDEQKQLFLKNATGLKGGWDDDSKAYAKLWAASVANVLAQPEAQSAQVDFTVPKLLNFVLPAAKVVLWDDLPNDLWVGALRAIYVSYAANNPAITAKQFAAFLASNPTAPKWSPDWCIGAVKQICFGSGITIWPARYNAIRATVERLYGVDLPDFAKELQEWQAKHDIVVDGYAPQFTTVAEIQTELITEGYDLGPAGADGRLGQKTTMAILTFQGLHGLQADGVVGPRTRAALESEYRRRLG